MRVIILISLLIYTFSFNLLQTKQSFDSYVMAVKWYNGYWKINSSRIPINHDYENKVLINGFWPLNNGNILSPCTSVANIEFNEKSELYQNLKNYWPNLENRSTTNEAFWKDKYNKYGSCLFKDYDDYFKLVIEKFKEKYEYLINSAFPEGKTRYVKYDEMKNKIQAVIPNAVFDMKCNIYIYELDFYLEKDFSPLKNATDRKGCNGILLF